MKVIEVTYKGMTKSPMPACASEERSQSWCQKTSSAVATMIETKNVTGIHLRCKKTATSGIDGSVAKSPKKAFPKEDGLHPADTEPPIRHPATIYRSMEIHLYRQQ